MQPARTKNLIKVIRKITTNQQGKTSAGETIKRTNNDVTKYSMEELHNKMGQGSQPIERKQANNKGINMT